VCFPVQVAVTFISQSNNRVVACRASYCCPDALKCLTPVEPGHLCDPTDKKACKDSLKPYKGIYLAEEMICCPLIHECVEPGQTCVPP
jgi:hypothetical protein